MKPGDSKSLSEAISDRGFQRKKGSHGARGFARLALCDAPAEGFG